MKSHRLPSHVRPERYALTLKPDLERSTFEGTETINLTLDKSVKEITLHAAELDITSATYEAKSVATGRVRYNKKEETATISFSKPLPKGKGGLSLTFTGTLNDQLRGFYRSRYVANGVEKRLATTQFEATDARRAFPCFDEPAQKAVFDVTLIAPPGMTAISNTDASLLKLKDGSTAYAFSPSPKMSTYLAAFIIGDFEYLEGKTKSGTVVRVHVTVGKKRQATFALDVAVRCLDFYEKYFAIPFPLPVMDMIAIPDFSHGAMENWGAVTYRETALLIDPDHSSSASKQYVAIVVAHELAHQWFGNLVTMEWWTHLWLNEGFASYIEYLAVDTLFPKWEMWTQFAYADLGAALHLDALASTHPIEIPVGHPDEIAEIFDEVSYSKGASVIRMLAGYLGERDFRDGLRHYLKKHSYQNASTEDLWRAFEKVSGKPVTAMMRVWTGKGGYPVIKAKRSGKTVTVSQSRFFSSPISKKKAKDKTIWKVPITVRDGSREKKVLLEKRSMTIPVSGNGPLKLNWGEEGFYRVDYAEEWTRSLEPAVRARSLPALDRLALVRDAFALAEAGESGAVEALELAASYENETDYTVWLEVVTGLGAVRNLLWGTKAYPQFESFARKLLRKIGSEVGWKPKKKESHTTALLRSLALGQLATMGDTQTIKQGLIMARSKKIPADLRGVVYAIQAKAGGPKEHAAFIARYKSETLQEEKNRLARALGQFKNEKLLQKTLDFALSDSVRFQDTAHVIAAVWANPLGRAMAWRWTKAHWKTLVMRYPSATNLLKYFVKPMGSFTSARDADAIEMFFKANKAPGLDRTIAQVLEHIRANAAWKDRDASLIGKWLSKSDD